MVIKINSPLMIRGMILQLPTLPNTAEVPPSDDDEEHVCQIVLSKEFCQHFLHSWRGSGFLIYLLNLPTASPFNTF